MCSARPIHEKQSPPTVRDGGKGQDGQSLWRRQSGTGGRPVESVRPRPPSCLRLSLCASVRRLGITTNLFRYIASNDPRSFALAASLGGMLYVKHSQISASHHRRRPWARSKCQRWVGEVKWHSPMALTPIPDFAMGGIYEISYRSGRSRMFACSSRRLPLHSARTPPKIPPAQIRCRIRF